MCTTTSDLYALIQWSIMMGRCGEAVTRMRSWLGVVGVVAALTACSVKPVSFTPLGNADQGPPGDAGVSPIDASEPPIDASEPPIDAPSPPSCSDGKHNGSETDVDCGGSCAPCAPGSVC